MPVILMFSRSIIDDSKCLIDDSKSVIDDSRAYSDDTTCCLIYDHHLISPCLYSRCHKCQFHENFAQVTYSFIKIR